MSPRCDVKSLRKKLLPAAGALSLLVSGCSDASTNNSQTMPSVKNVDVGLELPFPSNESWYFTGGPHYDGLSNGVRYAIDFSPPEALPCPGSPTLTNRNVIASASGQIKTIEGSIVEIKRDDGFIVGVDHIDNISLKVGDKITKGKDRIGNPSCKTSPGGKTDSEHVHLYIKDKNGIPLPIDGVIFSGWKVNATDSNYQGTMTKDGESLRTADEKHCGPEQATINNCGGARNDISSMHVPVKEVLAVVATPIPVPTPTLTPKPTETPRPTPTFTPRPTETPILTLKPTPSPTARSNPTPSPRPTEIPKPTPTKTPVPTPRAMNQLIRIVDAKDTKGITGIVVYRGERIIFQSHGTWCMGGIAPNAECGDPSGIRPPTKEELPLVYSDAEIGMLLAIIGDKIIPIGSNADIKIVRTGELSLIMNDRPKDYGDNSGSIEVDIYRDIY